MAISPQQLTIYLTSAHRAVIFAIAQLSCSVRQLLAPLLCWVCVIVDGVKLYRGIVDRSDTPRLTDTDHIHCSGRTTQCSYNEL